MLTSVANLCSLSWPNSLINLPFFLWAYIGPMSSNTQIGDDIHLCVLFLICPIIPFNCEVSHSQIISWFASKSQVIHWVINGLIFIRNRT